MRLFKTILTLIMACIGVFSLAQKTMADLKTLVSNNPVTAGQSTMYLNTETGWLFSESGKNDWKKATVPGCVHTDLVSAEELYYGDNEKKYQWIGEKDWEYTTRFRIANDMNRPMYRSFMLVFEQLDTYASVYFNGQLVMKADNAFRKWEVDVSLLVKKDTATNVLRVVFESPVKKTKELANTYPFKLPGGERVFARKAQFEFGWDWGPRFVTSGIRKPVYLVARTPKASIIEHIQIMEKKTDSLTSNLDAMLTVYSESKCKIYVKHQDKFMKCQLQKGINKIRFPFVIDQPQKWWPRGYGESIFYPLTFSLHAKKPKKNDDYLLSEKTTVHAFCDIQLVQEKDRYGKSFYFKVNGTPVFAKGVNTVPPDVFTEQWSERQLKQLYELNTNMVRVWGGGYYPSDDFYLYCLANGIMVWQDFMFACAMYPGDKSYIENVKQEVKEQVMRLQKFRNIALWCGNNENSEGWYNWGWQKELKYTQQDSVNVWNQYLQLFEKEIPDVLSTIDTTRAYWPSSPSRGWGRKESLTEGDCHYWGVWWGKQPIDTFKYKIPRFMSEYGMQAMPSATCLLKNIPLKGSDMDRNILANHQKHPSGFGNLDFYLEKYYSKPSNIFHYVYASQLLQAHTLKTAIEAHRFNRDKCMGTLLWQMNDCWPSVSWSLVDHDLNTKIAFEQVRSSFESILAKVEDTGKELEIWLVSDTLVTIGDQLLFTLYNVKGEQLYSHSIEISVQPGASKIYTRIPKSDLPAYIPGACYATISLKNSGKQWLHHFVQPRDLMLEQPVFDAEIVKLEEGYEFRLTSNTYCPHITSFPLDDQHELIYQDYIAPGHPLVISFSSTYDYKYYHDLSKQPGRKFMYLQILPGMTEKLLKH